MAIAILFFNSCAKTDQEYASMIIHGGTIYTVDTLQTTVEAVAIKDNTSYSQVI